MMATNSSYTRQKSKLSLKGHFPSVFKRFNSNPAVVDPAAKENEEESLTDLKPSDQLVLTPEKEPKRGLWRTRTGSVSKSSELEHGGGGGSTATFSRFARLRHSHLSLKKRGKSIETHLNFTPSSSPVPPLPSFDALEEGWPSLNISLLERPAFTFQSSTSPAPSTPSWSNPPSRPPTSLAPARRPLESIDHPKVDPGHSSTASLPPSPTRSLHFSRLSTSTTGSDYSTRKQSDSFTSNSSPTRLRRLPSDVIESLGTCPPSTSRPLSPTIAVTPPPARPSLNPQSHFSNWTASPDKSTPEKDQVPTSGESAFSTPTPSPDDRQVTAKPSRKALRRYKSRSSPCLNSTLSPPLDRVWSFESWMDEEEARVVSAVQVHPATKIMISEGTQTSSSESEGGRTRAERTEGTTSTASGDHTSDEEASLRKLSDYSKGVSKHTVGQWRTQVSTMLSNGETNSADRVKQRLESFELAGRLMRVMAEKENEKSGRRNSSEM